MKTLIKKKHKKNCFALEEVERGDWATPWAFPYDIIWANKWGNVTPSGRGQMLWVRVCCNDPTCDGEVWFDCLEIMQKLPAE